MANFVPQKPEFRQEIRLGLVVYGGVSLAIYMNGICREFYNAVRGRGIYKLIKALTDSDIIVDAISGTSAGGINGVLLSYALANSNAKTTVDFKSFAQIWRESGNINNLLREPGKTNDSSREPGQKNGSVESLLDGEHYYEDQLFNAFQSASKAAIDAPLTDWYSHASELDLFVTGTDVLGRVYKAFDNTGKVIEVKDHRTVFVLKHREGRRYPFAPEPLTQRALAKLCRITSCFPVAFPVVTVGLEEPFTQPADAKLVEWGQLTNRELPDRQSTELQQRQLHFVDGGVLDNRPFSYTINAIYLRTAYRPIERKLFYIDPSPDRFLGSSTFRRMVKPSIWKAALDSLVGMPRYESIANDLSEIKERNEKVRRYKFLRGTAERLAVAQASAPDFQNLKAVASSQPELIPDDASASSDQPPSNEQIYLRCRLVGLRDRILPIILRIDQVTNPTNQDKEQLVEKAAELITQYVGDQTKQTQREQFLHQLSQQIRNLDVDYAIRKHFFLLEKLCQLMTDSTHADEHEALKTLAENLGRHVELLEVIQAGLDWMLKLDSVSQTFYQLIQQAVNREATRADIYDYLLRLHRFLLDTDDLPAYTPDPADRLIAAVPADFYSHLTPPLTVAQLSGAYAQLKQKASQLENSQTLDRQNPQSLWNNDRYKFVAGSENNSQSYYSIMRKVERATEDLIRDSKLSQSAKESIWKQFTSFRRTDQSVYAYEYLSDIQAKELLDIIRVSPDDAQRGFGRGKGLEDKLAGDQLRAFGGFFKKSWRSNDIMWGRLDGLNRLVETLLTSDSLTRFSACLERQIQAEPSLEGSIEAKRQQYIEALIQESLPAATTTEQQQISAYLRQLAQAGSLSDGDRDALLDLLITAAQRDILNADLTNVLEDAIAEQLDWNQQLVVSPKAIKQTLRQLAFQPLNASLSGASSAPAGLSLASTDPQAAQLSALQQLNAIVAQLLNPKSQKAVAQFLARQTAPAVGREPSSQRLTASSVSASPGQSLPQPGIPPRESVEHLMHTAFPSLKDSDCEQLCHYPMQVAQTAQASVDDLYEFLNRLLSATKQEQRLTSPSPLQEAYRYTSQQLQQVINQLQPKFQPVTGYFDQTVSALTAKELARNSLQSFVGQGHQEDYFRNAYRVGSENITTNIPSIVLKNLAARTGLILRDIVVSASPDGRLKRNSLFQIVNRLLQLTYWSIQRRSPKALKSARSPKLLAIVFPLILSLLVVAAIVYGISHLPVSVLVAISSLTVLLGLWLVWQWFRQIVS